MTGRVLRAAAVLVLVSNAVLAWNAARNRRDGEAEVSLSERELPLVSGSEQDTAFTVRLAFQRSEGSDLSPEAAAAFGFRDDIVDALRRGEKPPWRGMPRRAWAVLEQSDKGTDPYAPSLRVAGVGDDPAALRAQHPNRSRDIVIRAILRANVWRAAGPSGARDLPQALRVAEVVPEIIAVPHDLRHVFEALPPRQADGRPRYAATIRFGQDHEPWMIAARRLP